MKPIAITFADEKFMSVALDQQINFNTFGIEHVIIPINHSKYDINLWLTQIDETIDAIKKYDKILKVDAEVRLEKSIPNEWIDANNVFFFIEPIVTQPYYIPINTGQIILDKTALEFMSYLKVITQSLIAPNYTGLVSFDDEDMIAPAIALSNVQYRKEILDYNRNDISLAKATRGYWKNKNTVLTHPYLHNWNTDNYKIYSKSFFRNHFEPNESVKLADAVILGLEKKNSSINYWRSLNFKEIEDGIFNRGDWYLSVSEGSFWHKNFTSKKFM